MLCKNCGKEISDNTRFCPNCGYNFDQPVLNEQIKKSGSGYFKKELIKILISAIGTLIIVAGLFGANHLYNKALTDDTFDLFGLIHKQEVTEETVEEPADETAKEKYLIIRKIPQEAIELNGHSYLLIHDVKEWGPAEIACNDSMGRLAIIESEEEMNFLLENLDLKDGHY